MATVIHYRLPAGPATRPAARSGCAAHGRRHHLSHGHHLRAGVRHHQPTGRSARAADQGTRREQADVFVCADLQDVVRYARVSEYARPLLERCLPGAYTFVLPATDSAPDILTTGQQTVGLRIPDHPIPLALVNALGAPILSTSANFSTQESSRDRAT